MIFRSSILGATLGATACTVLLAGCSGGSYYMVRQPGVATPYYTTGLERAGEACGVSRFAEKALAIRAEDCDCSR